MASLQKDLENNLQLNQNQSDLDNNQDSDDEVVVKEQPKKEFSKMTYDDDKILQECIENDKTKEALEIIEKFKLFLSDPMGFMAYTKNILKLAMDKNNLDIFKKLLELSPNVKKWEWGFACQTGNPAELPLFLAARVKNVEMIRTLIKQGAYFKTWYSGEQNALEGVKEVLGCITPPQRNAFLMGFHHHLGKDAKLKKFLLDDKRVDHKNMVKKIFSFLEVTYTYEKKPISPKR